MSAIPPKHTPDPAPPYDPAETGGGLVAMYNAASHASAESFPVLKAFQDYLEAERTQARKRVMQLTIFFAVLMGVVVTGFISAGIVMMRNMSTVQNKLLDVALAQKAAPAPAPAPASQTSPVLEESVKQMSRATTELQSNLDKKLDGVSEIATKVHDKVATQDGELEKLRAELRLMQEQGSKLKDEIVSLKEDGKKSAAAAAAPVVPKPEPPPPNAPAAPSPALAAALAALAAATPAAPPAAAPAAAAPAPRPEPVPATPVPAAAPAAPANDPRFPPPVKEPPVTPADVTPPPAPQGMMATAIPLKTKNIGTIPWRVLIPE